MNKGMLINYKSYSNKASINKLNNSLSYKSVYLKYRVRQILFLENALKKTTEYFFKFFYLKIQSFQLLMENNFAQMATSANHVVAYTIGPIFKQIIDCV